MVKVNRNFSNGNTVDVLSSFVMDLRLGQMQGSFLSASLGFGKLFVIIVIARSDDKRKNLGSSR